MDLGLISADFVVRQTTIGLVPGTVAQVLQPDPSRWAIVFSTTNAGGCAIGLSPGLSLTSGILLTSTNVPVTFNFRDFGALTGQGWFALAGGVGANVGIIEVLYRPTGRGGASWQEYTM
jgi:hypothetical protein